MGLRPFVVTQASVAERWFCRLVEEDVRVYVGVVVDAGQAETE